MNNVTLRYSGLPWMQEEMIEYKKATIVGCGGIGSWLALLLSRADYSFTIYDFDYVEETNLGGQCFSNYSLGESKVSALHNTLLYFGNTSLQSNMYRKEHYTEECASNFITCSAVDNMAARKRIFENWIRDNVENVSEFDPKKGLSLFIDGRLEAEFYQVYCVLAKDQEAIDNYRETLIDDSLIEDAPCTIKQTSHVSCSLAADMVGLINNHISNIYQREELRSVPFKSEKFFPLFLNS